MEEILEVGLTFEEPVVLTELLVIVDKGVTLEPVAVLIFSTVAFGDFVIASVVLEEIVEDNEVFDVSEDEMVDNGVLDGVVEEAMLVTVEDLTAASEVMMDAVVVEVGDVLH